jgi:hypothetical protein
MRFTERRRHSGWGLSILVGLVLLWAARPGYGIMITEIMYHPPGESADTEDEALEFVELYNNQPVSEELSGWAFTAGISYVFEPNTMLGPTQYLIVARDPNAFKAAYPITDVVGPYTGKLANEGERITLSNADGGVVLSFRYGTTSPWPVAPNGAGHCLVLAKLGGDPEEAGSWAASAALGGSPGGPEPIPPAVTPTTTTSTVTLLNIGAPGRYFKGTKEPAPSASGQPTTDWTQVNFNDDPATTGWRDGPSGYGYSNDLAELQWVETQLSDMQYGYLSLYARLPFTLTPAQIASFTKLTAEIHYDDGYVVYLNGARIAASPDLPGTPPAYNTANTSASDYLGVTVDLTAQKNLLVTGTNILAVQVHNSDLPSSDCFIGIILKAEATGTGPIAADDPAARIVINELSAGHGATPGWVELYNPGPVAVDLSRVYLSNDRFNLLAYKTLDGTILAPGGFWAMRQGASFAELPFALDPAGGTIYVTAAAKGAVPVPVRVLDAACYDGQEPGISFGRYPDGSPYLDGLAAPTFGGPNAQRLVRDIVINEIMYHHATRDDRFQYIELYNRGTRAIALDGWSFTSGVDYTFGNGVTMPPGAFLVVAKDPGFLAAGYSHLTLGTNLAGPFTGSLSHRSECLRLSFPRQTDSHARAGGSYMVTEDEVTYHDGGRWPEWADGMGASLELRDPHSNNDTPGAWADSDESGKTQWKQFSFTINAGDTRYTHDVPNVFDFMLLNDGEVLLDDLELVINGSNCLTNGGFENGETSWRILGNHTRSFVSTEDHHSGTQCLHLIATGHGDPGANRINQSINGLTGGGSVTFRGWARWLHGNRFLLLRTSRSTAPVMPPRPAHAFELEMPLDLGTPGLPNTALVPDRGPDILEVQHAPLLPAANQPLLVTARVTDDDGVKSVTLNYRSEGTSAFTSAAMTDDGSGGDKVAGDGIYTATIPGASSGTLRAFYLTASDGTASTRFPTALPASADVPDRTCLVRVGDNAASTRVNTYRVWMSNEVVNVFRSRANLSNELMDCTFVYNDTDVFYNALIRFHGSPFLRSGSGQRPYDNHSFRIEFNPDQKYRGRSGFNLVSPNDEKGPLRERASYWFSAHVGLPYSNQEWVRLISNGHSYNGFYDIQQVDADYAEAWFPDNPDGFLHKIDDYFEYSVDGTSYRNLDEGLHADARHPALPETYRWHFEKRSHPEGDEWSHLYAFAAALNTPSTSSAYATKIESMMDPRHFAKTLALRHVVGDWDSYGYTRGKNNSFYYALPEGKWYLLPWDFSMSLGDSSRNSGSNLFEVAGQFPEVTAFLNYAKYKQMYYDALQELVDGPWQTSYGTNDPPTAFDRFLDEAADMLVAEGAGDGGRNTIKQFVQGRRNYILSQITSQPTTRATRGTRSQP